MLFFVFLSFFFASLSLAAAGYLAKDRALLVPAGIILLLLGLAAMTNADGISYETGFTQTEIVAGDTTIVTRIADTAEPMTGFSDAVGILTVLLGLYAILVGAIPEKMVKQK